MMTNDEATTRTTFLDLEQAEWRFLLTWVLVSAVGLGAGMFVYLLVGWPVGVVAGWAAFGAVVGTAQWLVLRKRFRRSGWWGLASAVGLIAGMFVNDVVSQNVPVAGWAAFGAVVGTAQWLVLRKRFRRCGWWVLASVVGWAVGMAVGENLANAVGWLVWWAVGFAGGGAVGGTITGYVLTQLLRHPIPEVRDL